MCLKAVKRVSLDYDPFINPVKISVIVVASLQHIICIGLNLS